MKKRKNETSKNPNYNRFDQFVQSIKIESGIL